MRPEAILFVSPALDKNLRLGPCIERLALEKPIPELSDRGLDITIQWYGFYEGHTAWRTDLIVIAFIFGLRSLEDIESAFPEGLDTVLFASYGR